MSEDRLAVLRDLLGKMATDFDAAVTGLDAYLEKENPFTPDEAARYESEFGRLDAAVRQANRELQNFSGWLASRHAR